VNGKEEFSKLKESVNTSKAKILYPIEEVQTKLIKNQQNTNILTKLDLLEKKL